VLCQRLKAQHGDGEDCCWKLRRRYSFGEHELRVGQVCRQLECVGEGGGTSLMWRRNEPAAGRRDRH